MAVWRLEWPVLYVCALVTADSILCALRAPTFAAREFTVLIHKLITVLQPRTFTHGLRIVLSENNANTFL